MENPKVTHSSAMEIPRREPRGKSQRLRRARVFGKHFSMMFFHGWSRLRRREGERERGEGDFVAVVSCQLSVLRKWLRFGWVSHEASSVDFLINHSCNSCNSWTKKKAPKSCGSPSQSPVSQSLAKRSQLTTHYSLLRHSRHVRALAWSAEFVAGIRLYTEGTGISRLLYGRSPGAPNL